MWIDSAKNSIIIPYAFKITNANTYLFWKTTVFENYRRSDTIICWVHFKLERNHTWKCSCSIETVTKRTNKK